MAKKGRRYNLKKTRRRYVKAANELIDKAEAKLADAILLQNQLQKAGVLAEGVDVKSMKEHLHNVRKYISHHNFTYKHANKLKEFVKDITRGNILEKSIQVKIQGTKQLGDVTVPDPDSSTIYTYGKIKSLQRRQATNPAKINQREFEALATVAHALNPLNNIVAANTAQLHQQYRNMNKRQPDAGFGGNSALINDLAYSYDALPVGRDWVERFQQMMGSDLQLFNQVEILYRTSSEGREIKRMLDQAVGSSWYDMFMNAKEAILRMIHMIKTKMNLSEEQQNILNELKGEVEYEESGYET